MNANRPQKHGLTAIDGAMVLIVILLIVQIWLLSATLESYLAGHREAAVPGRHHFRNSVRGLPRALSVRRPDRLRYSPRIATA